MFDFGSTQDRRGAPICGIRPRKLGEKAAATERDHAAPLTFAARARAPRILFDGSRRHKLKVGYLPAYHG